MNTQLFSGLNYPFRNMLQSLEGIKGYDEYLSQFIVNRMRKDRDWEAEVCALFEINKPKHPLVEICSQEPSKPEGIFELSGKLGIIEAAKIGYLFDTNDEYRTKINRIQNHFTPVLKFLRGEYDSHNVRIEVNSASDNIPDDELEQAKTAIIQEMKEEKTPPLRIATPFGNISIMRGESINITTQAELLIGMSNRGRAVYTHNADLNKKVARILKIKRTQHKTTYRNHIKFYYFFVDCPPENLLGLDPMGLFKQLEDNEIVYLGTKFAVSELGKKPMLMKSGMIIPGTGLDVRCFDLSNRYYKVYPLTQPEHVIKIF